MMTRIFSTIALLVLIILVPWWIYAPLGLFLTVAFAFYWEIVVLGFVADLLYSPGAESFFAYPMALIALIVLLVVLPLREKLRFNA